MTSTNQSTTDSMLFDSLIKGQQEIEKLLKQLESDVHVIETTSFDTSQERKLEQRLQDLETLINTHFVCEEYGLFPTLKKYHPMILMEKEHDLMTQLREEVKSSFQAMQKNPSTAPIFKEEVKRFSSEIKRHFKQESQGIYRIAERDLSSEEKKQVVRTIEELRTKAGSGLIYTIQRPEKHFYQFKSDLNQTLSKPLSSHKLLEHPEVDIKQISIRAGESQTEQWAPTRTIVICQRGEVKCQLKDEDLTLEPGSGILIESGLAPTYTAVTDCDLLFIIERI